MHHTTRPEALPLNRQAHYLTRSGRVGFPACSVALCVRSDEGQWRVGSPVVDVRMIGWEAVAWEWDRGSPHYLCESAGCNAPSLWDWLLRVQSANPSLWVWQLGASHGLTLLGWWDRVEAGEWVIPGMETVGGKGRQKDTDKARPGICVVSDPPTIILSRRAHVPGAVRWLDVRNLGLDAWEDVPCSPGDAEALAAWLRDWYGTVADLNMGGLRSTAASQAWHGWRHAYLSEPLLVHDNERAIRIERDSLHPGRCESLQLGRREGPVYALDASAHYPSCATATPLPGRLVRVHAPGGRRDARALAEAFPAIARCRVSTATPCAPCRHGGLTIWPVGTFKTCLCWPEVELLLRHGAEVDVEEMALYEPARPFDAFFRSLWEARRSAQAGKRSGRAGCIKRLMNSLIGRCAQWDWCWESYPAEQCYGPYATWDGLDPRQGGEELLALARRLARGDESARDSLRVCRWRSIGWHSQYERCGGESENSMPALTAWVSSVARVRLWDWIQTAGPEEVLYYDSDSLWVTERGRSALAAAGAINPDIMGGLRVDGMHEWLDVRGQKYYATPQGVVCAGVSDRSSAVSGSGWQHWSPEKVTDALRRGESPRAAYLQTWMPEHRPYRHGRVAPDGTVTPIRLPE